MVDHEHDSQQRRPDGSKLDDGSQDRGRWHESKWDESGASEWERVDAAARTERVRDLTWLQWWQVLLRVKDEIEADRLSVVAAGVAFFAFLSIFPTLTALISVWGLLADPARIGQQIGALRATLPDSSVDLLIQAAQRIAAHSDAGLSWGLLLSLLFALWSANRGMLALINGISIAYDLDGKRRNIIVANGVSLLMTLGAIALTLLAIGLVVAIPILLSFLGLGGIQELLFNLLRWPALAMFVAAALAVIFRVAPCRPGPPWPWVTPGSVVATILWLLASYLFSLYTQNFANYDKFYGSIAAVAILLFWFYISAFIILLGAELNSEAERQPRKPSRPHEPLRQAVKRGVVDMWSTLKRRFR